MIKRPHRLRVRTSLFQGEETGSNPVGAIFIILVIGVSALWNISYSTEPAQYIPKRGVLSLNISSAEYSVDISRQKIIMRDFDYRNPPGRPDLPAKVFTIALPPGAVVDSIEVLGDRRELSDRYRIAPVPPILPLMEEPKMREKIMEHYEKVREDAYSSDEPYPEEIGKLLSKGGLRRYRLVDIAFYPFSYKAKSGRLYYTPFAYVKIYFSRPPLTMEYEKLLSDTSMDEEASLIIYNWEQAKEWYRTAHGHFAPGYLIITNDGLQPHLEPLRSWKTGLGFDVYIVTKEWINGNVVGIDIQQKIRNYLRDHLSEYQYVLIVGSDRDIPMRRCVPFNDDSLWEGPLYSPIPTDLYYAELTDPDDISWDSDGDGYYGEVYDQDSSYNPEDNPDYHADVHLGRIPWSTPAKVSHICQKIIDFEKNTDLSYKRSSLLAGGVLYYENENSSGEPRLDGADLMERLLNNGILERDKAVTLYEKDGLSPSTYPCTAPLNKANLITNWRNRGIFNEFNHGDKTHFVQKIWFWDDGDHIPEDNLDEMHTPIILESNDAPSLDDNYPANGFLSSCLNAYPEAANNLGASLLYQGAVSIIASTRVSWSGQEEWNYRFFNKLLKDTSATHSRTGDAFDASRNIYGSAYAEYGGWLNIYDFVLYGEPSLCHFGTKGGTPDISVNPDTLTFITMAQDTSRLWVKNEGNGDLTVSGITKSASWIISINPTSFTITPGDSQRVEVVVNPEGYAPDTYYDNLDIGSNDPDENPYYEPVKLVIQTIPDIAVYPDTLEIRKSQDTARIWVKNAGNIDLSISNITKTASWITSISPVSFSVQPGDSERVDVTIDGSDLAPDVYYDTLRIASNDPDENPYYEPVKLVIQTMPDIAVYPDTLKFKKSQDTASMWVKNKGNTELSVSNITKDVTWIVSIDPISFGVQPGDSQRVEIIVDAAESAQDTLYTLLEITSNDPDENPYYQPVMLMPFLIVYPGDTDNNGTVDGRDVLPIGRYWRLEGPSRGDLSTDWGPKSAIPWTVPAATHADCNGDGIIDGRDVLPIGRNWRKTHTSSGPKFVIDLTDPELKSYIRNFQEIYASLKGESEAAQEIKGILLKIIEPVPQFFRLYQNCPNPFYEKTSFRFDIPEKSRVSLKIYNCAGGLVASLIQGVYEPGYYNILWNRRNNKGRWVASGIYFCRAVMQPISPVGYDLTRNFGTNKREGLRTLKKIVILERRKK